MNTHPLIAYQRSAARPADPAKAARMSGWAPIPAKALAGFTRSLAVMVSARIDLVTALEVSAAQCRNRRLSTAIAAVRTAVQQGQSLSSAMAAHPRVFDDLFVNLTRVGEMAGILDEVLQRLATHLEKASALRRRVQMAMVYPAVVLSVAVGATVFLLTGMVPTFAEMFSEFGAELPAPTRLVLAVSALFSAYWLPIAGGIVLASFAAARFVRTPSGRLLWHRAKLKVPLIGTLLRKSLVARFSRTLGTLLASGVQLTDALSVLARSSGNAYLEQHVAEALRGVARGAGLSQPLRRTGIFPEMVLQVIAVGEATSELDRMLLHAAQHFEEEVDAYVETLTSIVEPVMIVLIGCVLGSILVALYLPMFDLIGVMGM